MGPGLHTFDLLGCKAWMLSKAPAIVVDPGNERWLSDGCELEPTSQWGPYYGISFTLLVEFGDREVFYLDMWPMPESRRVRM
jgi:hypothetical protein